MGQFSGVRPSRRHSLEYSQSVATDSHSTVSSYAPRKVSNKTEALLSTRRMQFNDCTRSLPPLQASQIDGRRNSTTDTGSQSGLDPELFYERENNIRTSAIWSDIRSERYKNQPQSDESVKSHLSNRPRLRAVPMRRLERINDTNKKFSSYAAS